MLVCLGERKHVDSSNSSRWPSTARCKVIQFMQDACEGGMLDRVPPGRGTRSASFLSLSQKSRMQHQERRKGLLILSAGNSAGYGKGSGQAELMNNPGEPKTGSYTTKQFAPCSGNAYLFCRRRIREGLIR